MYRLSKFVNDWGIRLGVREKRDFLRIAIVIMKPFKEWRMDEYHTEKNYDMLITYSCPNIRWIIWS